MSATALDLDLSLLVGEMPAPPCEHSQHGSHHRHDDGPATHYVQTFCPACGLEPKVIAACERWVNGVSQNFALTCDCGLMAPASYFTVILGPVDGSR